MVLAEAMQLRSRVEKQLSCFGIKADDDDEVVFFSTRNQFITSSSICASLELVGLGVAKIRSLGETELKLLDTINE